MTRIKP